MHLDLLIRHVIWNGGSSRKKFVARVIFQNVLIVKDHMWCILDFSGNENLSFPDI
jgi:hypothetical protein